jgi:hypothetical protein
LKREDTSRDCMKESCVKQAKEAGFYRRREQIELERAARAPDYSARRAHLGLADLYRREFENAVALQNWNLEPLTD